MWSKFNSNKICLISFIKNISSINDIFLHSLLLEYHADWTRINSTECDLSGSNVKADLCRMDGPGECTPGSPTLGNHKAATAWTMGSAHKTFMSSFPFLVANDTGFIPLWRIVLDKIFVRIIYLEVKVMNITVFKQTIDS